MLSFPDHRYQFSVYAIEPSLSYLVNSLLHRYKAKQSTSPCLVVTCNQMYTVEQCAIVQPQYYIVSRNTAPVKTLLNYECSHDDDGVFLLHPTVNTSPCLHDVTCCVPQGSIYNAGSAHTMVQVFCTEAILFVKFWPSPRGCGRRWTWRLLCGTAHTEGTSIWKKRVRFISVLCGN